MSRWPGNAQEERTAFGGLSRGQLMSRVRSSGNQTTEQRVAAFLRRANLKGWRRHISLPGKPDFVWPQFKVAVFVDGCFWHGHNCGRNLTPRTNAELWRDKIQRNKTRDRQTTHLLRQKGWTVVRIWECHLAKNPSRSLDRIRKAITASTPMP